MINKVREFQEATGAPVGTVSLNDDSRVNLRLDLVEEEWRELYHAAHNYDVVEVADALADIIYVAYGFAVELGIPLDRVLDEVHRSNMSKIGGPVRADGKQLKPETYSPPNVRGILEDEGLV